MVLEKDIYGRNKQKEFTAVELTNVLYIIKFEPGQLVPWKKYIKHFNTQENKMHQKTKPVVSVTILFAIPNLYFQLMDEEDPC